MSVPSGGIAMSPEKPQDGSSRIVPLVVVLALLGLVGVALEAWRVTTSIAQSEDSLGVAKLSAAEIARRAAKQKAEAEAVITSLKSVTDYQAAKWHPIHFKPAVDKATDEQCLTCHQEVLSTKVRSKSPAGVEAATSIAWYQTLDTYEGAQESFHARHLTTPFAKDVMNLSCNFCHQGHDVREEAPSASATAPPAGFTLRKVVDPSQTCLLCHGAFPSDNMGLEKKPWHVQRADLESVDAPNGCLTCHAEQFRTVRHQVSYLKADAIEANAKNGTSDTCFGCHGGRAWYRISYPYPRHPWPGMDKVVPDWAKGRPAASDPRYATKN